MLIAMSETMFQSVFATKDTLGIHFHNAIGLQVSYIEIFILFKIKIFSKIYFSSTEYIYFQLLHQDQR